MSNEEYRRKWGISKGNSGLHTQEDNREHSIESDKTNSRKEYSEKPLGCAPEKNDQMKSQGSAQAEVSQLQCFTFSFSRSPWQQVKNVTKTSPLKDVTCKINSEIGAAKEDAKKKAKSIKRCENVEVVDPKVIYFLSNCR